MAAELRDEMIRELRGARQSREIVPKLRMLCPPAPATSTARSHAAAFDIAEVEFLVRGAGLQAQ